MQPNTTPVPNPTDPPDCPPVPAELLETVARLGVSRETVRRLAIAGALPHTVVCRGVRKATRRFPRRFADGFTAEAIGRSFGLSRMTVTRILRRGTGAPARNLTVSRPRCRPCVRADDDRAAR